MNLKSVLKIFLRRFNKSPRLDCVKIVCQLFVVDRQLGGYQQALFIPKKDMTQYKVAYLKALFRNGVGAVNILYLSNEEIEVYPVVKYVDN